MVQGDITEKALQASDRSGGLAGLSPPRFALAVPAFVLLEQDSDVRSAFYSDASPFEAALDFDSCFRSPSAGRAVTHAPGCVDTDIGCDADTDADCDETAAYCVLPTLAFGSITTGRRRRAFRR